MSRRQRTYSRRSQSANDQFAELTARLRDFARSILMRAGGFAMLVLGIWFAVAIATFSISDPSYNTATGASVTNIAGPAGAAIADLALQWFGGGAYLLVAPLLIWGGVALFKGAPSETPQEFWLRVALAPLALIAGAGAAALFPIPADWPFVAGPGGVMGDAVLSAGEGMLSAFGLSSFAIGLAAIFGTLGLVAYCVVCGLTRERFMAAYWSCVDLIETIREFVEAQLDARRNPSVAPEEDSLGEAQGWDEFDEEIEEDAEDADETCEKTPDHPEKTGDGAEQT